MRDGLGCRWSSNTLQLLERDRGEQGWHGQDLRHPVRSVYSIVALARRGAVDFEDARGVEGGAIDLDTVGIVTLPQTKQDALEQIVRGWIVGQVDAVDQMRAVAAVCEDRIGPAEFGLSRGDVLSQLQEIGRAHV